MGRVEQKARRRQRGRGEQYEIRNIGDHPVRSRFSVQGPSGRAWEVTLWDLANEIYHCSCPDFATNGLGTCKHVESVLHHLEESVGDELAAARAPDGPGQALIYLDAARSPPRIFYKTCGDADETAEALLAEAFGAADALTDEQLDDFGDLVERAAGAGILVAPEAARWAREKSQARASQEASKEAARAFRDLREHLPRGAADRPPEGEGLQQWVERFADLTPWQLDGAEHLVRSGRGVLADDIELDKTHQTLAATEFLRLTERASRMLILCPPSRRHLWCSTIRERSGLEARVVGGTTFEELARSDLDSPYTVVPYNRLFRHLPKLKETDWDLLALDEVQRVKSWPAPTGQAIKSFQTRYVFALTSARLEQRPQAFFYTVQLLDPYLLGPAWSFLEQHVIRDRRGAEVGHQHMNRALDACRSRWLRRAQVDLPDQDLPSAGQMEEIHVDVTNHQHRQLDPLLRTLLAMARVKQVWSVEERQEVVRLLDRTRTICTVPELLKPQHPGSPKLDELCHLLEDLCRDSRRRIAVFSREQVAVEAAVKRLAHLELPLTLLEAGLPGPEREAQVKAFTQATGPSVLLASDVAADGLDLKGQAEVVVHLDLSWCPPALARRRGTYLADGAATGPAEYAILCSGTPEAAAAEALRRRPEFLTELVSDPVRELQGLEEAEEWTLRELIGLVVQETMVLRPKKSMLAGKMPTVPTKAFTLRSLKARERNRRTRAPQPRYLLGQARAESGPAGSRPLHARPREKPSPAAAKATARVTSGAGDILVLGLETREDRLTLSSPSKIHTLGLAMAVTYSFKSGKFTAWRSEYINDLVRTLLAANLVVGYNPHAFEYKILGPYTGRNLNRIPTVDLVQEITKQLGQKVPFDLVTAATLEKNWSGDRSKAAAYFNQNRIRELASLCTEGVKIVRDLFLHSVHHGRVYYKPSPKAERAAIELAMKSRLDAQVRKLLGVG